jgi:alkylation response protein AidB-like acyl-CoA dehydrogenase
VDFAFSEEQDEFRETLRRFLAEKSPSAEVRRVMESPEGYDPVLWKQMATELGLQGLALPEACGGQGFGCLELGIVFEEMGRALLPSPYLATVGLAASAIQAVASEAEQGELLPGIASGATVATLALGEAGGGFGLEEIALRAVADGDVHRLTGRKTFVLDAAVADLLLVVARTPEGALALFALRSDEPGVRVTPTDPLDPLRRHAHLDLDGAVAQRLGSGDAPPQGRGSAPPLARGSAAASLRRALQRSAILVAAEMVGAAQRCLEMSVEHAKARVQFARPIGSFQAIKHKTAEVLLEVECARSAAYWSWWAAEQDDERQLAEAAHVAKAVCGDALARAAAENVQIHAGIGFTWEHDAQLFYKRARSADVLLGDARWHRARLADLLGLTAAEA